MDIRNKKIMVTGGAGFIGSHLVDALIELGAEVVVLDNLSTGRIENVNKKAFFYQIDIVSPDVDDIFFREKPIILYNLAANTNVPLSIKEPLHDFSALAGALNVIECCHKYNVERLIFTSSGFIYGNTKNRPIKESEPFKPISPYAISKKTVEHYLRFYNEVYDLNFIVLRFATVFGPRQVKGAMADYINKLANGKQAEMYGDGNKTRDYVYIKDIIDLLIRVLDFSDKIEDPVFNIGSGNETTLNHLYDKIAEILNKKAQPIYMPDRKGELNGYSLDSSKARSILKWTPKYSLEDGLKLTMKHWGVI